MIPTLFTPLLAMSIVSGLMLASNTINFFAGIRRYDLKDSHFIIESNGRSMMSPKYTLRTLFLLFFISSFFLQVDNTPAGEKKTIKEILSNPDKYDGQEVTIQGKATKVKPRTSKKGNDSTTFTLKDESGKGMNIYTRGHPLITEGQKVTVTGIYQKLKMVGRKTFHNEVEARNIVR